MFSDLEALEQKLRALPETEDTVFERIDLLNELGWGSRRLEDWQRVLAMAREARRLSEQHGYTRGVAGSLRNSAFAHYMLSDLETANAQSLESLRFFEEAGDEAGVAHARGVIGYVQWTLGNYDRALREAFEALRLAENCAEPWGIGWCCTLIGGIYQSLHDYEQAVRYHTRSHEIFLPMGEPLGEARSLTGLGAALRAIGDSERALHCLQRSLELFRKIGNRNGESRALSDLGSLYQQQGREDEALSLHLESLRIREREGNRQAATTSLLQLAHLYLAKKMLDEAIEAGEKALRIAGEIHAKPKAYQAHQVLSDVYERRGDPGAALHHARAFHRLREEVFNEEASTRVRNFQISWETERSQREAEIQRLRNVELAGLLEELQATQAQLVQSEKMAALGGLVGAIAHELNSPLGTIQSAADVSRRCVQRIAEEFGRHGPDAGRALDALGEQQDLVQAGAARISQIVRSLKSFAQLDGAEFNLVDLNQALDNIVMLAAPQIPPAVRVVREFGEIPPLYVYAAELNQVFMNLLQNAAAAIDGEGSISICTLANDRVVRVRIADTGRGIPKERMGRLFDPGVTVRGSQMRAAMSLFTCLHIMRKHGGSILVDSEEGKGAEFTLELPRSLERQATPVAVGA